MHYTTGDGKLFDPTAGHDIFADEDPPTRDATQLTHELANALTEEVANVILSTGVSLNASSESIAQMTQLLTAIDKKDTDSAAALQVIIDALKASDIANDSGVTGSTVKDGLDDLDSRVSSNSSNIATNTASILLLNSNGVSNVSAVSGATVTAALNTLAGILSSLNASDIENTSGVGGATVEDALENLLSTFDNYYTKVQSDAKYGIATQQWNTHTLALMGGDTGIIGPDLFKQEDVDASGNFGWSDLDVDDTIVVTKKSSPAFWDTKAAIMLKIDAFVVDSNTIKFSFANPSISASFTPFTSTQVIVRRIKKVI